jgi:phage gp36-like protein
MTRHVAVAEQGHKAPLADACQVIDQLGWAEYHTPLRRQVPDVLDRLSSCVCRHRREHHQSRRAQARDVT